jgi:hypothetical protein
VSIKKQIKRLGAKRKHLRNTKKNTFFHKYERIEKKKEKKFQLYSHGSYNSKVRLKVHDHWCALFCKIYFGWLSCGLGFLENPAFVGLVAWQPAT